MKLFFNFFIFHLINYIKYFKFYEKFSIIYNDEVIKMAYHKEKKTSLGTKIFIWFMFGAMLFSFVGTLVYYLAVGK